MSVLTVVQAHVTDRGGMRLAVDRIAVVHTTWGVRVLFTARDSHGEETDCALQLSKSEAAQLGADLRPALASLRRPGKR